MREEDGKDEEQGIEQREEDHPDDAADEEVDPLEEEQGGALLDGDDVEEAVDELWGVDVVEAGGLDAGKPVGEVGGGAHEDAALDDVGDDVLVDVDDGLDGEGGDEGDREDDEGLQVGGGLGSEGRGLLTIASIASGAAR